MIRILKYHVIRSYSCLNDFRKRYCLKFEDTVGSVLVTIIVRAKISNTCKTISGGCSGILIRGRSYAELGLPS